MDAKIILYLVHKEMFVLDDIEYVRKYGDRQSVYDGVCYCTTGGLTKENLEKRGARIISKRRSALGKLRYKEKNPFIPESPDLPPPPPPETEPVVIVAKKPKRRRKGGRSKAPKRLR